MRDRELHKLAAGLCRAEHPEMDFDLTFYKRGAPMRVAIGLEMQADYLRRAREILGR